MAISCRTVGPITARTMPIARKLCGQELRDHQQSAGTNFAQALDSTPSDAVIISSEALGGLLRIRNYANAFFTRIRELNLEPKLVLFVRNQSQRINSSYSQWSRPSAGANHSRLSFKEPLRALFLDTRP